MSLKRPITTYPSLAVAFAPALFLAVSSTTCAQETAAIPVLHPTLELRSHQSVDPDDMCICEDLTTSWNRRYVLSDKSAHRIDVFDDQGQHVQTVPLPKPGNIDQRTLMQNSGSSPHQTIVAVNLREPVPGLAIFAVNSDGKLERIDAGITTRPNYGGCLAMPRGRPRVDSPSLPILRWISTSETDGVTEYLLHRLDNGKIKATEGRHWNIAKCEGAVADDQASCFYVAEEQGSIFRISLHAGIVKTQPVAAVGQFGLTGDLEGLTLARHGQRTLLIVSDQGRSRYAMLDVTDSTAVHYGEFMVRGASDTDGIDCYHLHGQLQFLCHTDQKPRRVLVSLLIPDEIRTSSKP